MRAETRARGAVVAAVSVLLTGAAPVFALGGATKIVAELARRA